MNKQFFYTEKRPIQPTAETVKGASLEFKLYRCSFNIKLVIRSIATEDDRVLVLLNDLHQRLQEVPVHNKAGKITAYKKEMNTFQSEIYLEDPKDIERFYLLSRSKEPSVLADLNEFF